MGLNKTASHYVVPFCLLFLKNFLLQGGGDFFNFITFNKVAFLNVIIIFKTHAAFIAFFDFFDVVFEAFELA